jgi:hypothetical protein
MSLFQARRLGGVRRFAVLGLTSLAAVVGAQSTAYAASTAPPARSTASDTVAGCPLGYLCLYKAANYNNFNNRPDARYYHCGTVNLSGWVTTHGSFVDNQTGNVISAFWSGYNATGSILLSIQAYTYASDVNFYPVNSITVC